MYNYCKYLLFLIFHWKKLIFLKIVKLSLDSSLAVLSESEGITPSQLSVTVTVANHRVVYVEEGRQHIPCDASGTAVRTNREEEREQFSWCDSVPAH